MAGRAVGVVLSGGAAHTAAHLGVLRALMEAGVPIDVVGGTSAGGGIAAQVALGWDADRLLADNVDGFQRNNPFLAPTIPLMSLVARTKLDALARKMFGDTQIEDLWLEFFCVSCDLNRGHRVVHERGSLWRAVRATSAIPGISVPMVGGGAVLVDGGVLDNLPVSTMRALGCRTVLAVDVSPDAPLEVGYDYEALPAPARVLWHWLWPLAEALPVPSIADVLTRSVTVGSHAARREALDDADVVFRPPTGGRSMLDFGAVEEVAALAYDYAREVVERELGGHLPDRRAEDA